MTKRKDLGGVIHTYQRYDPTRFPSPRQPTPDLVSPIWEHVLRYGRLRELSEEQLAHAVRIDPSQIGSLGPSLDSLITLLLEHQHRILKTYETNSVEQLAQQEYDREKNRFQPPKNLQEVYEEAVREEQLRELRQIYYVCTNPPTPFGRHLIRLIDRLENKYRVDEMAGKYAFFGQTPFDIPEALQVKEELEKIDSLLEQLREARESGKIGIVNLQKLAEIVELADVEPLHGLQEQIQNLIRDWAERQGLERDERGFRITPRSLRLFQGKLLERLFSQLEASSTGHHQGPVVGNGSVEFVRTNPFQLGDSLANMDVPATLINAMIRTGTSLPIKIDPTDLEIHQTRNTPKCATCVLMDMSGSMRHDGLYVHVKRMALALDGLIRQNFPGDSVTFLEMATFAKRISLGDLPYMLPKPVTLFDPVVRLRANMSRPHPSESQIPPHFTNLQHGLAQARRLLALTDTSNRQVVLITDGLPTAHFEEHLLYLLYPPDPRTEMATLREGARCRTESITINVFLLSSWSQSQDDIRFAHRLAESTSGRVFFTAGHDLDRFVLWDYVRHQREIIA